MLNKNGEVLISGEYKSIDFYKDEKIIMGKKEDGKIDLLDAGGKRVASTYEGRVSVGTANYFIIVADDKNIYYTLDGGEIYQQNKK